MYRNPYDSPVTIQARKNIEDINKKINEELEKEDSDKHMIMRLEEQKLIQNLFYGGVGSTYAKYCSPW